MYITVIQGKYCTFCKTFPVQVTDFLFWRWILIGQLNKDRFLKNHYKLMKGLISWVLPLPPLQLYPFKIKAEIKPKCHFEWVFRDLPRCKNATFKHLHYLSFATKKTPAIRKFNPTGQSSIWPCSHFHVYLDQPYMASEKANVSSIMTSMVD